MLPVLAVGCLPGPRRLSTHGRMHPQALGQSRPGGSQQLAPGGGRPQRYTESPLKETHKMGSAHSFLPPPTLPPDHLHLHRARCRGRGDHCRRLKAPVAVAAGAARCGPALCCRGVPCGSDVTLGSPYREQSCQWRAESAGRGCSSRALRGAALLVWRQRQARSRSLKQRHPCWQASPKQCWIFAQHGGGEEVAKRLGKLGDWNQKPSSAGGGRGGVWVGCPVLKSTAGPALARQCQDRQRSLIACSWDILLLRGQTPGQGC